jgi:hypothetical protein
VVEQQITALQLLFSTRCLFCPRYHTRLDMLMHVMSLCHSCSGQNSSPSLHSTTQGKATSPPSDYVRSVGRGPVLARRLDQRDTSAYAGLSKLQFGRNCCVSMVQDTGYWARIRRHQSIFAVSHDSGDVTKACTSEAIFKQGR